MTNIAPVRVPTTMARLAAVFLLSLAVFNAHAEPQSQIPKQLQPDSNRTVKTKIKPLSADELSELNASMVWVEGGEFTMGSDAEAARPREKPAHRVSISSFSIAKTEVTQALFERIMGWNVSYFACSTCPVNNVSWMNVQLFVKRLNAASGMAFSLPSEAQWEYAAKGGQRSKGFLFSGANNIESVAWFAGNSERKSHPVASRAPNELGLYDMTGNLWEYCEDDMSRKAYRRDLVVDPVLISNSNHQVVSMKVIRGGGYEYSAQESEVFKRDAMTSNVRMPDVGFRLVLPAQEESL